MSPFTILPVLACSLLPMSVAAQAKPKAPKAAQQDAAPKAKPRVKVMLVRPKGVYADLPAQRLDPTSLLLGGGAKPTSFFGFRGQLESLATHNDGRLVFFDLTRAVGLNGPQLRELERTMHKLRASGRKSVAYLENATSVQYQLAALCDRVYIADMGSVDFRSPALSVTFLKDALDLFGVRMDIVRCGEFKGAVEPYMLSQMSDHLRAHYLAMLSKINDDIVRRVAKARGLEPAALRRMQARRMLSAAEALKAGLVDRVVPFDGAKKTLARIVGTEDYDLVNAIYVDKAHRNQNFLSFMNSLFSKRRKKRKATTKDTIAVLHLSGAIVDGSKDSAGSMVSGPTVRAIERLEQDDNVKGVVARINSPGGSATASEAIRRALERLAKRKPLVYSMGNVAASGGYWITCTGRPIVAEASTITGSIGVFGMKPNLGPMMRRLGVREDIVALDQGAYLSTLSYPWPHALKERMQALVNDVYARFLQNVADSRGMAKHNVAAIAGGRVWSGKQAKARGLVDTIGGLDAAIAMVAKAAKLDKFETMHTPRSKNFMDSFVEDFLGARSKLAPALDTGRVTKLALRRLGNLETTLAILLDALRNHSPMRVWAIAPAELRLQ